MSHPSGKTRTKDRSPSPADRAKPDDYLEAFAALFPARVVQRIARESGFVRRHRSLDPVAFRYPLASETGPPPQRTLATPRGVCHTRTPIPFSAPVDSTSASRPHGSSSSGGAMPTALPGSEPLPGTTSPKSWPGSPIYSSRTPR
jgi:hypothetical protein